jgi:hypothetical protein
MENNLKTNENDRQPQNKWKKWKTTSNKMEEKMEDDLIKKMEDDLKKKNGRQP